MHQAIFWERQYYKSNTCIKLFIEKGNVTEASSFFLHKNQSLIYCLRKEDKKDQIIFSNFPNAIMINNNTCKIIMKSKIKQNHGMQNCKRKKKQEFWGRGDNSVFWLQNILDSVIHPITSLTMYSSSSNIAIGNGPSPVITWKSPGQPENLSLISKPFVNLSYKKNSTK